MNISFNNISSYNAYFKQNWQVSGVKKTPPEEERKTLTIDDFKNKSALQIQNTLTRKLYEDKKALEKEQEIQKTPMQQALEQMDEILKAQKESKKQEEISKKIAKGEASPEEEAYLAEKNPELHKKATIARENTENLRSMVKNAKTKGQAKQAISTAKALALGIMEKDFVLGDLMMEGINKVEEDYHKNQLDENPVRNSNIMSYAVYSYQKNSTLTQNVPSTIGCTKFQRNKI